MNGPDGKRFPWGEIIQTHWIGDFEIVEHHANVADNSPERDFSKRKQYEEKSTFHPFVEIGVLDAKWHDVCRSYPTLDSALVGAIAYKYGGSSQQADLYACKILGIPAYY